MHKINLNAKICHPKEKHTEGDLTDNVYRAITLYLIICTPIQTY